MVPILLKIKSGFRPYRSDSWPKIGAEKNCANEEAESSTPNQTPDVAKEALI